MILLDRFRWVVCQLDILKILADQMQSGTHCHAYLKPSMKAMTEFQAFCDKSITLKREYDTYQITNLPIVYMDSWRG
jgi:hypothetical protein